MRLVAAVTLLSAVSAFSPGALAGVTLFTSEPAYITAVGNHDLQDFEAVPTGAYGTATTIGDLTFDSTPSKLSVNGFAHSHGAHNTTAGGSNYLFGDSAAGAFHDDLHMGVASGALSAWGATFTDLEVGPIVFKIDGVTVATLPIPGGSGLAQFIGFIADPGETFDTITLVIPDITYGIDDIRTASKSCEFGVGCPGSGGFIPHLTSVPCGAVDINTQLAMTVSNALGGANVTFFLGLSEIQLPIGGSGCDLLITPLLVNFTVPLGGTGPGNGFLNLAGVIPPSAAGLGFKAQAFVHDPAGVEQFSATNGLSVDVN